MKKRSKIILIVTVVVLIILLCIAIPIVFLVYNDYGVTVGRLLVSDVGNMVIDGKTVIIMSDQSDDKDIFDGLRTGDKILVVHDGVEESLPARTGAFHIFRLAKGDKSDIPEDATSTFVVKDYAYEADAIKDNMDAYDFDTQYIRTNGGIPEVAFPSVKIIRSLDELDAYIQENKEYFDFERKETPTSSSIVSFMAACDKYYAKPSFFQDNMLVFVVMEEGSGSIRHKVSDVGMLDEELYVFINSQVPEVGTDDMAQWHVMIELNNSIEITNESEITVYLDKEEITAMDTKAEEYETGDLLFREWQFRDDYFEKGSYTLYRDILETQVPNLDKILFIFNGELKETIDYCELDVVIDVPKDGICQFIAVDKDGNEEDITPVSIGEVNCIEDNGILFLD